VLHPRRSVLDLDFATLEREVAQIFRTVQAAGTAKAQK
jgi:ribonuclease P protein component